MQAAHRRSIDKIRSHLRAHNAPQSNEVNRGQATTTTQEPDFIDFSKHLKGHIECLRRTTYEQSFVQFTQSIFTAFRQNAWRQQSVHSYQCLEDEKSPAQYLRYRAQAGRCVVLGACSTTRRVSVACLAEGTPHGAARKA